jgi:hypothetical protein
MFVVFPQRFRKAIPVHYCYATNLQPNIHGQVAVNRNHAETSDAPDFWSVILFFEVLTCLMISEIGHGTERNSDSQY